MSVFSRSPMEGRAYVVDANNGGVVLLSRIQQQDDADFALCSRLEFTIANDAFSATFVSVRNPTVLQFQVVAVTAPSGLWFGRQTLSDGVEYRGGWIVLPSGEQRGAVVLQASRELVATPTLTTSSPSVS